VNKKVLRKLMKERLAINENKMAALHEQISLNLKNFLIQFDSQRHGQEKLTIGGYSPLKYEPVWFQAFDKHVDWKYSLVHMHEDITLTYHSVDFAEILTGELGLRLEEQKLSSSVIPDVVLIPGLAYTRSLERLGRGKAYFDNYLKNYKGEKIGLFFGLQEVDDVFLEKHDMKLDLIITEKEIIRGNK
jgi:5-formyltetrahydrofolate cyclo-ligase